MTPKTMTGIRATVKWQLFPLVQRASERLKLHLQPTPEEPEEKEKHHSNTGSSNLEVLHCGSLDTDNLMWESMDPDVFREKELDELFNLALVNELYRMYDEAKVDACYGGKYNKSSQKHHDICVLDDVPVHVI